MAIIECDPPLYDYDTYMKYIYVPGDKKPLKYSEFLEKLNDPDFVEWFGILGCENDLQYERYLFAYNEYTDTPLEYYSND